MLGSERQLTSFQALEILEGIQAFDSFERMECVCFIYSRLLYPETFVNILNALSDKDERENIRIRLNFKASEAHHAVVAGDYSLVVSEGFEVPDSNSAPYDSLADDHMTQKSVHWSKLGVSQTSIADEEDVSERVIIVKNSNT